MTEYEIREKPDGTLEYVEVADESAAQARAGAGEVPPPSQLNVGGWQRSRDPVTGEDVLFNPTTREIERRPGTPPPQRGGIEIISDTQARLGNQLLQRRPQYQGNVVYDPELPTGERIDYSTIPGTGDWFSQPRERDPLADAYRQAQIANLQRGRGGGSGNWRVQGGYLINQATGEITAVGRPGGGGGGGRMPSPGEEEQNLAAAANQRAQAAYNQARADGYAEEQARQKANDEWQRTYQQGQLEIQRGQLGLQTRLGEQRLGLDERQLDNASRDTLARQAIERGQLDLARQIQGGQLDVQRNRLGLEERLGTERLGLDRSTLENARNQAEAERNLRARTALGDIGGQQTLEAELGRRAAGLGESRLGLDTSRLAMDTELGRAAEARQTAGLYGYGSQGRTLESQRLAGELTGGTPTLERTFGYSDRLGTLDGQTTLAGRQANLAEDTAAFQRLSTPSAVGNLAALERRGLVPASALQTGQVRGLSDRTGRFGGVGDMGGGGQPTSTGGFDTGGATDMRWRGPIEPTPLGQRWLPTGGAAPVQAQPAGTTLQQPSWSPAAPPPLHPSMSGPAVPLEGRVYASSTSPTPPVAPAPGQPSWTPPAGNTKGRMFAGGGPSFNEATGQYNRTSTFGGGGGQAQPTGRFDQRYRGPGVSSGQPSQSSTFGGGSQAPLQYSLQSLKGLSPRDTQTLAGYTGGMGRDFGDIQNQAVNEMADLGEGLHRRRGYRLGG